MKNINETQKSKASYKEQLTFNSQGTTASYRVNEGASNIDKYENIVGKFEMTIRSMNEYLNVLAEIKHSDIDDFVNDLFLQIRPNMGVRELLLNHMAELNIASFTNEYQQQILQLLGRLCQREIQQREDNLQATYNEREAKLNEEAEANIGRIMREAEAEVRALQQLANETQAESTRLRQVIEATRELEEMRSGKAPINTTSTRIRVIMGALRRAQQTTIPQNVQVEKLPEIKINSMPKVDPPKKTRRLTDKQRIRYAFEQY